jgi:hypothetical protein
MRKQIGLAAISVILIIVVLLFVFAAVNLTDFTTQLAAGLTLLCSPIFYFMFKPEIDSWMISRHKQTSFQSAMPHEPVISPSLNAR